MRNDDLRSCSLLQVFLIKIVDNVPVGMRFIRQHPLLAWAFQHCCVRAGF